MTTQHTPGLWRIAGPFGKGKMQWVWRGDGDENNSNYHRICRDIENPADARLIAAAPDLLEALEKALAYKENPGCGADDWMVLAERAIAKAEGR